MWLPIQQTLEILAIPAVSLWFSTSVEAYGIKTFAFPPPQSWEKAIVISLIANLAALGAQQLTKPYCWELLSNSPDALKIFIVWFATTTVANAIEPSIVKWVAKVPITGGLALITTPSNSLVSYADLYHEIFSK